MTVRTRFAPSPTGRVHIGNIRTAIYNWLFARHEGGQFLLRLEDTDRQRSTPEAVATVFEALEWLGMNFDEEPLYQSSRREAHLEAADRLLANGYAYREDKGDTGRGECVVFRMPGRDMTFQDEIKGRLKKKAKDLQDFVIVRSDGSPVFHLANVVDDLHMGITHVVRGDDHVENTFRHLALYRALEAEPPAFAHLPMIVNAQGKPYSKRDGDAYLGELRDKGYLPDAVFNYLALLGWSPGDDREVMSRDEMIASFELQRVQAKPAQMDLRKMAWMNGEYMRALPSGQFNDRAGPALEACAWWDGAASSDHTSRVLGLLQERVRLLTDLDEQARYFFCDDFPYDEKAVRKRLRKPDAIEGLAELRRDFAALTDWSAASLERALRDRADARDEGAGKLIHPVRVAVSGQAGGPGLFEMLEVLGRDRVLQRIDGALERFQPEETD